MLVVRRRWDSNKKLIWLKFHCYSEHVIEVQLTISSSCFFDVVSIRVPPQCHLLPERVEPKPNRSTCTYFHPSSSHSASSDQTEDRFMTDRQTYNTTLSLSHALCDLLFVFPSSRIICLSHLRRHTVNILYRIVTTTFTTESSWEVHLTTNNMLWISNVFATSSYDSNAW